MEFLGFLVDFTTMTLALPREKVRKIQRECQKALTVSSLALQILASLIGLLNSSIQAVFPAPLHYRHLQSLKNQQLCNSVNYESEVQLSPQAREELVWWRDSLMAWNRKALVNGDPNLAMETDASLLGWGAVCNGVRTGGLWTQSERLLHINCLELMGGAFAVKAFTQHKTQVRVLLLMDNVTAVTYINKMGRTRSPILSSLAFKLWTWCLQRQTRIIASRLPYQIPRYASWRPDPGAETVDAFYHRLVSSERICLPPFRISGEMLKASHSPTSSELGYNSPSMGNPTLVSTASPTLHRFHSVASTTCRSVDQAGGKSPPNPPSINRVVCLNRSYSETGISAQARTLLMPVWQKNTSKWASWCYQQQVNPISAPLSAILDFLMQEFNSGKAYWSINVYRSAISMTHPIIDSVRVGEHPMVCQLMKGIFNKRPPLLRYSQTWKVHQVTSYLEGLGDNAELFFKQLARKLVVLLALTSAARGSEVAAHDL